MITLQYCRTLFCIYFIFTISARLLIYLLFVAELVFTQGSDLIASIKPNKYQYPVFHSPLKAKQSSQALMFDAPTVDMCSLEEEIEAVTGG